MTNYQIFGSLKEQEFTLSQFQRPEIQNQGVFEFILAPKTLEKYPSLPLPLFDSY